MKATINFSHLFYEFKTSINDFLRKSFASNISKSCSHFHHYLAVFLFIFEIGFNFRKDVIQKFPSSDPMVYYSIMGSVFGRSRLLFRIAPEGISHPVNRCFVAASDTQFDMKLKSTSISSLSNLTAIKRTIAIYIPSKIDKIFMGMIHSHFNFFGHDSSLVHWLIKYGKRRNNRSQPQRLTPSALVRVK